MGLAGQYKYMQARNVPLTQVATRLATAGDTPPTQIPLAPGAAVELSLFCYLYPRGPELRDLSVQPLYGVAPGSSAIFLLDAPKFTVAC